MKIMLNGQSVSIADGGVVATAVVEALAAASGDGSGDGCAVGAAAVSIPADGLAVAVNGEVVPRSQWDSHRLAAGDCVDVLTAFVGG